MECQLEHYQPQPMDDCEDEMAEYSNVNNDYKQQQVQTVNFPTSQQSNFS